MVAGADRQEVDEGNLHSAQQSDNVPGGVCNVDPTAISSSQAKDKSVQGDQVGNEGIATPGSGHPVVEESAQRSPHHRSLLDGLDPEEEGEDQQEDGNGLIIITASHRPGDIAWGNTHKDGGQETSRLGLRHLIGEEVGGEGSEARKGWGKEDTDVSDIDGDRQESKQVVNDTTGNHQAWIESSASDATERVPGPVIEPIPEAVKSICDEVFGGSEIEPRIEFVDD